FDLCRLDGFNATSHPVAINIIKGQDRGTSSAGTAGANYRDFTRYGNGYFTPTDANFLFPVPVTESSADPNLIKAPVPYVFH
ncbi:MAG: RagB/SusD family nutrient uptake outer membrane protein, partial [Mucilaginibacter sp.]